LLSLVKDLEDDILEITSFVFPAVVLIIFTSITLLIGSDWRLWIAALGIQYVGVFILIGMKWPLELAVVKLVTGWISSAVLGIALIGVRGGFVEDRRKFLARGLFHVFTASLVGLAVISLAPSLEIWLLGATPEQVIGGSILVGMGLLHLGLTIEPLRIILGLLTIIAGFEILYAAVETSTLVTGLLAIINLGIALVGGYLLIAPSMEVEE
jgi:hypothetical protein